MHIHTLMDISGEIELRYRFVLSMLYIFHILYSPLNLL